MADDEDHERDAGPTTLATAASVVGPNQAAALLPPPKLENLWKQQQQQQVLPLWFSKKEQDSAGGSERDEGQLGDVDVDGKLKRKEIIRSADSLDDCGLELSLGLSLGVGGAVAKLKSKNARQEEKAFASDGAGVEKKEEDPCGKDYELSSRRGSDSGRSRTQAFWRELSITRDGQSHCLKQEIVSPQTSDAVLDRLGQSQSADATSATGLSSLGSPTVGRLSLHAGLIENWGATHYSMEDSKAAFAHDFWKGAQQNASHVDEVNAYEEKPLVKDLLRVANQGVAASSWGRKAQGGMAMQLLNGFRDVGDVDPVMRLSPAVKMNPTVLLPVRPKRSPGNECGDTRNDGNLRSADASARQQCTGEVSSQDEPIRDGTEHGQVCDQDTTEEAMKQSRQVARKKRKALIEEQKLQKKVKKDVGGPSQSGKQPKQNAGIASAGLMASQSRPLLGSSREPSAGAHDISSPADSQNGEASTTGFSRKSSAVWQHGSAWDDPAASSPEPPPDTAAHFNQNENGIQVESEKESDLQKGDSSYRSHRRGLTFNRHSGGDLGGHDSASAVSALSGNGMELRQGQGDSSWRQSMGDLEVNNQSAAPKTADLLENDPVSLQRMSNRAGLQKRGDPNGSLGRSDVIGIPRRGLKYIENPRDAQSHAPKDSPSAVSHRPLPNELSLGTANRGGIFSHLQSASSLPSRPQFGPLRPWPDSGDVITSHNVNVEGYLDLSGFTGCNKAVCQQGSLFIDTNDEVPPLQNQDGASIQRNRFQLGTTQSIPTTSGLVVHVGQEASSLKLGIAAGQMFGGTGSSPDLPWVTCTGAGPNGRTICGVLYRYQKGQVRIVCACHGRHMSPSEFVEHAGSLDLVHPEKSIVVGPFTVGTNATPVQR